MPTAVQGPPVGAARPQLWRITDRRTFQDLRQRGQRARRGPLTVTWLAPAPGEPATPPTPTPGSAQNRSKKKKKRR